MMSALNFVGNVGERLACAEELRAYWSTVGHWRCEAPPPVF
jgi:hypothetical protein